MKKAIQANLAPAAIGSYSPAIRHGNTVYLSGQIPLDLKTMELVSGDIQAQVECVFENLKQVTQAAEGTLDSIVKLTVFLMDLSHVTIVNEVMARLFTQPFPARTTVQVSKLPKEAKVEIDAIMVCSE